MLFYATETVREIYWPLSSRHLTRNDVANRSCAISHLLRLLCKADLSCLGATFKLRAAEDLWRRGGILLSPPSICLTLFRLAPKQCHIFTTPRRQTSASLTVGTSAEAIVSVSFLQTVRGIALEDGSVEGCERFSSFVESGFCLQVSVRWAHFE